MIDPIAHMEHWLLPPFALKQPGYRSMAWISACRPVRWNKTYLGSRGGGLQPWILWCRWAAHKQRRLNSTFCGKNTSISNKTNSPVATTWTLGTFIGFWWFTKNIPWQQPASEPLTRLLAQVQRSHTHTHTKTSDFFGRWGNSTQQKTCWIHLLKLTVRPLKKRWLGNYCPFGKSFFFQVLC